MKIGLSILWLSVVLLVWVRIELDLRSLQRAVSAHTEALIRHEKKLLRHEEKLQQLDAEMQPVRAIGKAVTGLLSVP